MGSILLINQTYSTVIGVLFNIHSKQSQKNLYPYVVRQQNAHAYTYIHTVNKHTNKRVMLKHWFIWTFHADRIHIHEPHMHSDNDRLYIYAHTYIMMTIDHTYTRIHGNTTMM